MQRNQFRTCVLGRSAPAYHRRVDAGTEAIVRLAWSRRLGLADDSRPGSGRSFVMSDGNVMGVVLGDSSIAVGTGSVLPQMGHLSDQQLIDPSTLLSLAGGRGRLLGEWMLLFTDKYVADTSWTSVAVDDDPDSVAGVQRLCPPDDVLEVGLSELDWQFAVRDDADALVGGAGFAESEGILANIGVLTAPSVRGRGWATRAATVATNEALDRGLIPQWRARRTNVAALATAARLGYVALGGQTSVLLT